MALMWYYQSDGQEIGPVSSEAVQTLADQGVICPSSLVRQADALQWFQAGDIHGMAFRHIPNGSRSCPHYRSLRQYRLERLSKPRNRKLQREPH